MKFNRVINGLTLDVRYELSAAILEACCGKTMTFREIKELEQCKGHDEGMLRDLVNGLSDTLLLWLPPHATKRRTRFITTSMGKKLIGMYREAAQNRSEKRLGNAYDA